jgi:hypothetical protein
MAYISGATIAILGKACLWDRAFVDLFLTPWLELEGFACDH